jgi:hypothetical protein
MPRIRERPSGDSWRSNFGTDKAIVLKESVHVSFGENTLAVNEFLLNEFGDVGLRLAISEPNFFGKGWNVWEGDSLSSGVTLKSAVHELGPWRKPSVFGDTFWDVQDVVRLVWVNKNQFFHLHPLLEMCRSGRSGALPGGSGDSNRSGGRLIKSSIQERRHAVKWQYMVT